MSLSERNPAVRWKEGLPYGEDGVLLNYDTVAGQLRVLEALVRAVKDTWNGISCSDVEGKNWFDLRDSMLEAPASSTPAAPVLICAKCGKDRYQEACPQPSSDCPIVGTAQQGVRAAI